MQLVNQYSALFSLILPVGLLATAVVWRHHPLRSRIVGGFGLLLLVFIGYFLIQPEADAVAVNEVERLLTAADGRPPDNRPLFLYLYSDY